MKGLLIVSTLVACTLARPDIGLNYRHGTPTGSYLPSNNQYQQSQSRQTFVTSGNGGYSQQYQQHGFRNFDGQGINNYEGNQQYTGGFQNYNGFQQGHSQVLKNVYFYDSPEDLPAPTIRLVGGGSSSQTNHKIIFIKAPGYQAPQIPQIPAQSQNAEKTLVYVLVKKPDAAQDIVLPSAAASKQSKPEVYFIKYKTQQEAAQHVQSIQQGGSSGVSANSVHDQQFIGTITDTKESSNGGNIGVHNNINSQIFGSDNNGGHQERTFQATHTSTSVTTGNQGGQVYGPAGASGPY